MSTATASKPRITPADLARYEDEGYILLRGAFSKQRVKSLIDGLNRIMDDVQTFGGDRLPGDDCTMIVVKRAQ